MNVAMSESFTPLLALTVILYYLVKRNISLDYYCTRVISKWPRPLLCPHPRSLVGRFFFHCCSYCHASGMFFFSESMFCSLSVISQPPAAV